MKHAITIVEANSNDIPSIQSIAFPTWRATFGNILSEKQIDYMLEMMYSTSALQEQTTEKNHHFILAMEEENPAGFASYQLHYNGTSITKLHKIYILPALQGKGIGKYLMDHIACIAKANSNTMLSLNVNRFNQALFFYKKYGFEKVGEEDIDIGNGYLMEDFILEKPI